MENKKIVLEGNIGCGKSTLINFLKTKLDDIKILDSGFSLFHPNLEFNPIIYNKEAPEEWTFLVQVTFMKLLNVLQNKSFSNKINIFNRSIYSVHNVFNRVYKNDGYLSNDEYLYLTNLYNKTLEKETVPIDLLIFFKSSAEVLEKRTINNTFKLNIPKYQIYYDALLDKLKTNRNIRFIYIIDADRPLEDLKGDYNNILQILSE